MEQELQEDKLSKITIDLDAKQSGELNESFLRMFGYWTKKILAQLQRY